MDGWHLCWLSTTNSYDSIDKRMRLGYVPVKADELPGYEDYRVKSGEHVGYISCNEMLLFKLPMDIYQEVMLYQHHEKPREEAEKTVIASVIAAGAAVNAVSAAAASATSSGGGTSRRKQ